MRALLTTMASAAPPTRLAAACTVARSRSTSATVAPSRTSRSAIASPMPRAAPVIRASVRRASSSEPQSVVAPEAGVATTTQSAGAKPRVRRFLRATVPACP